MKSFCFKVIAAVLISIPASIAIDEPSSTAVMEDLTEHHTRSIAHDIHRVLMGRCNGDTFLCPAHSERKRGRSCYDSFDDCECDLGYKKTNKACVAQEGLCSIEYVKMVEAKQSEVEHWVDMVYGTTDGDEQYGYIQKMNFVLSEAWDDYNAGKASCEIYVFDDEVDGSGRRLRCCSFLRRGFKTLADNFVKIATAVVKVVTVVIEVVVDVVLELVECGVGIATQGARCGLIGCAFGLYGVAADIAFMIATGGTNKLAGAVCSISEGGAGGEDDKKKSEAMPVILEGVGSAVCEINKMLESPALDTVCDFRDQAQKADNGLLFFEKQLTSPEGQVVFRFLEAFQRAMCGNPGSAFLDLIEEVVSCQIGCSTVENVFCSAPSGGGEVDIAKQEISSSPQEEGRVEFEKHGGKACRTRSGGRGKEGSTFKKFIDHSEDDCESLCSDDSRCKGWEYNSRSGRCEIWREDPEKFADASGVDCYVKL